MTVSSAHRSTVPYSRLKNIETLSMSAMGDVLEIFNLILMVVARGLVGNAMTNCTGDSTLTNSNSFTSLALATNENDGYTVRVTTVLYGKVG
jgi:hypothetical protein